MYNICYGYGYGYGYGIGLRLDLLAMLNLLH